MSVLPVGFGSSGGVDTGDIGHSLRFRGAQYLSRAFSAQPATGTFSAFVKRGTIGAAQSIAGTRYSSGTNSRLEFTSSDTLAFISSGSTICSTSAVYRDPTAPLHVVLSFAPSGTAYLYVNGVQVASGATGATPWLFTNTSSYVNAIGRLGDLAGNYLDGYLSRICFIDGTALTPSSFGYQNTAINEWVSKSQSAVKAVVDAGGTNSFMLDFDNATSLTTLGYDKSSKGNNWTLNNFSLTAGTTYDHMLDVPGNSYATLNPLDKSGSGTLSNGNLIFSQGSAADSNTRLTLSQTEKTYLEFENTGGTASNNAFGFGIALTTLPITSCVGAGGVAGVYAAYASNLSWLSPGSGGTISTGGVVSANTINKVAFDPIAGNLWLGRGTTWYNSSGGTTGDPSTGANPTFSGLSGQFSVFLSCYALTANAYPGQAPLHASATYDSAAGGYFRYTPPTGFKALCQASLPDVAILNPKLHFDVKTRTGTAATYSVTGLGFQPDLVWSKSRGRAVDHALYDSVRGVQKQLESNSVGAETTETTGLTAFNSDGYTGGALDQINGTTATNSFVDWLWKAGGAAVTNTAGSITSQVSANVDAGFSVVTGTMANGGGTVGHGVGKTPGLIIAKVRSTTDNWFVWHKNLTNLAQSYLWLDTTNAQQTSTGAWNNVAPTTTTFGLGSSFAANGTTFVAYCFADIEGYSKAFSYTGNASTDGAYVDLGFKPRWILLKCSSTTGNWVVFDTTRDTYNVMGEQLYPNLSNAGSTVTTLDVTSRGFKARIATDPNSAQTFIGFAIADVAGKYSLGR